MFKYEVTFVKLILLHRAQCLLTWSTGKFAQKL